MVSFFGRETMKLVIIVILQSLHLTRKGMISSLSDVVYHPDVALTVVRLIAVTLVMIVVGASVVLVVSHCVCPFFIVEYFIWKRQQENSLACFREYSIMNPRF
jgi:hypothetical protein